MSLSDDDFESLMPRKQPNSSGTTARLTPIKRKVNGVNDIEENIVILDSSQQTHATPVPPRAIPPTWSPLIGQGSRDTIPSSPLFYSNEDDDLTDFDPSSILAKETSSDEELYKSNKHATRKPPLLPKQDDEEENEPLFPNLMPTHLQKTTPSKLSMPPDDTPAAFQLNYRSLLGMTTTELSRPLSGKSKYFAQNEDDDEESLSAIRPMPSLQEQNDENDEWDDLFNDADLVAVAESAERQVRQQQQKEERQVFVIDDSEDSEQERIQAPVDYEDDELIEITFAGGTQRAQDLHSTFKTTTANTVATSATTSRLLTVPTRPVQLPTDAPLSPLTTFVRVSELEAAMDQIDAPLHPKQEAYRALAFLVQKARRPSEKGETPARQRIQRTPGSSRRKSNATTAAATSGATTPTNRRGTSRGSWRGRGGASKRARGH